MKKNSLYILLFSFYLFSFNVLAQEGQHRLTIELIFPKKSTAAVPAPKPQLKPIELSGLVLIDIAPYPSKIEEDRYSLEYFLDEQLIYETSGFNEEKPTQAFFSYTLDTTAYENGPHKIIVNFWDKSGPSAIGIREISINNPENNYE